MTTKEITITATSGGYYGGNNAQISVDGTEIGFGNYSRGLNVAVFDENTGLPLFSTSFDTPIGAADSFADLINSIPTGRIVALAVQGDAGTLAEVAKNACKAIGSGQIDSLSAYQSYALIGIKGHDPGTAGESIDTANTTINYLERTIDFTLDVEAVKDAGTFTVEAISKPSTIGAGYSVVGGNAQIKVNGNPLTVEGGYQSGWNLAVLDRKDGQVKTSGRFNPWVPSEVDKFVQTIQDLQAGEIVAIATKDYAGTNVEPKAKKACSSIGATMVSKLGYGGNWAIVGYKGAKPGKAVESLTPYLPPQYQPQGVEVKYWAQRTAPLDKQLKPGKKLSVDSSGPYYAVGIDGDYALVGDSRKNDAYMYHWQNGQWQLQQHLKPTEGRDFGNSVDISGNFAIVGESGAFTHGVHAYKDQTGVTHIYEFKGGQWQHQQTLRPSTLRSDYHFGNSVAIDGKVAIVGAYFAYNATYGNHGLAYIFQLENGKWVEKACLQPDRPVSQGHFGSSVSIYGNVAIVGSLSGGAYIFHLKNGKWEQQQQLQPPDSLCQVAINGNRVIVGTYNNAAYIYQLQDGKWELHQKIQATDHNAGDNVGYYFVGIGGDVAIVGGRDADAPGKSDCGAAYLFQLVNSKWEQKQKLQPSDLPAQGWWGTAISFDGSRTIIGGSGHKLNPQIGFAYICDVTTEA